MLLDTVEGSRELGVWEGGHCVGSKKELSLYTRLTLNS